MTKLTRRAAMVGAAAAAGAAVLPGTDCLDVVTPADAVFAVAAITLAEELALYCIAQRVGETEDEVRQRLREVVAGGLAQGWRVDTIKVIPPLGQVLRCLALPSAATS